MSKHIRRRGTDGPREQIRLLLVLNPRRAYSAKLNPHSKREALAHRRWKALFESERAAMIAAQERADELCAKEGGR